jgi:FkbM family methyltransferase
MVRAGSLSVSQLFELFIRSPEFEARLEHLYAWAARRPELVNLRDGSSIYVASTGDADISGAIRSNSEYEPAVTAALRTCLSEGGCFIDVGASLGYFTVLAARAVGNDGRVVAFEPGPHNQSMVLLNLVHNGLTNVELLPYALSDRREVVSYRRLGSNGAIAPLLGAESVAIGDLVQALPMDEVLADERRIDVVKIDVEGAEGRVLRGAATIIDRFRPTLLFELTPGALAEVSDTTGAALLHWLEGYGYSFRVLTGLTRDLRAGPLGTDDVLERFEELDALHVDVMASQA